MKRLLVVIVLVFSVLIVSIPQASAQTIYACVNKMLGSIMRWEAGPGKCLKGETEISWNIKGPAGQAGKDGAPGFIDPGKLYGTGCGSPGSPAIVNNSCSCIDSGDILLSGGAECQSASHHLVGSNFSVWFKTWWAECADENNTPVAPLLIDILCMRP